MRSLGLTNFLLKNISLFVNTFATIFALIFCFVSGVGIVFILAQDKLSGFSLINFNSF